MRSFLVGLSLALAALLTPVPATAQTDWQAIVASTGCTAAVESRPSSQPNGYYASYNHKIVLYGTDTIPYEWALSIAYHESGHCIQAQEGRLRYPGPPADQEWDADLYAIRFLERDGYDARAVLEGWWAYIYQKFGYKGDPDGAHGALVDRITRIRLNASIKHIEAP